MRYLALILVSVGVFSIAAFSQSARSLGNDSGPQPTWIPDYDLRTGSVFVMSNKDQNGVYVFMRYRTGDLSQVGYYATGGSGNSKPAAGGSSLNPLASQNSLVVVPGRQMLIAANAGSNNVTVFRISSRSLIPLQVIETGGQRPVSIAVFEDIVYILNTGDRPNISGFSILENDTLKPLNDAIRPLSASMDTGPSQIAFDREGKYIAVTEKATNNILMFPIDLTGRPGLSKSVAGGSTPYGTAFTSNGHLLVAEAFQNASGSGALSSYAQDGIGLNVVTSSERSGETGSCCVVTTENARFAFLLNSVSGSISTYRIGVDGDLNITGKTSTGFADRSFGSEMAIDRKGRFIYVLDSGQQAIVAFAMRNDDKLEFIGSFGLLDQGIQGIAAQ